MKLRTRLYVYVVTSFIGKAGKASLPLSAGGLQEGTVSKEGTEIAASSGARPQDLAPEGHSHAGG